MSKAPVGGRRSAAAMVRAAEGLHGRPPAALTDAAGIDGDAVDTAAAPPASSEAGAAEHAAGAAPDAPSGASGAAPDLSRDDLDAGAQGNLALPAERRRWDSLVSYPGDVAAGGGAQGAPPPAATEASASAGVPADAEAASSAARRAADDAALERKLDAIPAEPGVYLLRERASARSAGQGPGKVLYVGKAKSLRSRVRAYFRESGDTRFQVRFLMKRVGDFDTLVARSEKEALILENNLIKQYRPRYNIRLKDDKSYLSAKMTNHPWPRIMVTRKIVQRRRPLFRTLRLGRRPARDDRRHPQSLSAAHLLGWGFPQPRAPVYRVSDQAMPGAVLSAGRPRRVRALICTRREMLLEGRNLELLKELRERMRGHADRLEFEEAARLRDQRARDRKDRRAADRASSLGYRPGCLRALSRRRLYRGDRPDGAQRQADQHAGMEFPRPRIRRRRHPRRPADAILLGRAVRCRTR